VGWDSLVLSIWQDARYGLRSLVRTPGTTCIIVLALGIGIGLNTAAFSIINAMFLRPLAVPDPGSIVYASGRGGGAIDIETFRHRVGSTIAGLTTHQRLVAVMSTEGRDDRLIGEVVASNYFDTLQIRAAIGRTFDPSWDDASGPASGAIISDDLWTRRFSRTPDILGAPIRIDGRTFAIVGVAPAGFAGVSAPWEPSQFWITSAQRYADNPELARRVAEKSDAVIARLAPGVSLRQMRAAAEIGHTNRPNDGPNADRYLIRAASDALIPTEVELESGPFLAVTSAVAAIAGIVMVIAVINTTGILLARGVARRGELAIRRALGAGVGRILRQLATESALMAGAGGLAGLAVAGLLLMLHHAFSPASILALNVTFDYRVLCFAGGVSLAAALAAGLAPMWQARQINVLASLGGGSRAGTSRRGRRQLRYGIVLPQIVLSVVLLVVAGSHLRPILRAELVEPGFRVHDIVTMHLDYRGPAAVAGVPDPAEAERGDHRRAFYRRAVDELRNVPGTLAVSLASRLPASASSRWTIVGRDIRSGRESRAGDVVGGMVSGGYFKTLDIGLMRGRDFDDRDVLGAPPVAIISESLARTLWPGSDPLGQSVARGREASPTAEADWLEVVGVVSDIQTPVDGLARPAIYTPVGQIKSSWYPLEVVMHAVGDPGARNRLVNDAIRRVDPSAELTGFRTMAQVIADARYPRRVAAWLLGLSGAAGLLLATIGLYGVVSYSVAEQSRDMGIRAALGASRRDIIALVLQQTRRLLLMSCAIGFGLGYAAVRLSQRFANPLFELPPTMDGVGLTAAVGLVAGVVLLACYIPARRASAADPLDVLRGS
jgi:putative ABC transport system permease protein